MCPVCGLCVSERLGLQRTAPIKRCRVRKEDLLVDCITKEGWRGLLIPTSRKADVHIGRRKYRQKEIQELNNKRKKRKRRHGLTLALGIWTELGVATFLEGCNKRSAECTGLWTYCGGFTGFTW